MSKKKPKQVPEGLVIDGQVRTKDSLLKSRSLEEVEDDLIGEKGTPKRDAYEADMKADLEKEAKKQRKKIVNLVFDNDLPTTSGVSEEATPAPDKKYSEQLSKALTHLAALDEIVLLNEDQVLTEIALDSLTKPKIKRIAISYPAKPGLWTITEMAKRQFVINETDTKYLRIAVRYSTDWKMKDTLLVFNRRK